MKKVLTSVLLLLTAASSLFSSTLQVPASYATIQLAVNDAIDGDTILVAPGMYVENINISNKDIHLISSGGAEVTTIMPNVTSDHHLNLTNGAFPGIHPHQTIKGFTFTGFTNVTNNKNLIYIWGASPEITDNIFIDNFAATDDEQLILAVSSEALIHHNLFINNQGSYPVYLNTGSNAEVYNNTFYENRYGVAAVGGGATIIHNIFMNTSGNAIAPATSYTDYNNFYRESTPSPEYPGENSLYEDPLFVDAISGDYHLSANSPMINAGDPAPIYNEIDNSTIDIGRYTTADSLLPLANAVHFSPVKDSNMVTSLNPDIIWSYWDTAATTQQTVEIEIGTDSDWTFAEIWNSGAVSTSDTIINYSGSAIVDRQLYFIRIRVDNGSGFGVWKDTTFFTNTGTQTFTVPGDFATIQAAVDECVDDDSIRVLPGTYVENIEVKSKRVSIFSTGGSEFTTISASNSSLPVISIDSIPAFGRTSIDGFTISDGSIGIHAENSAIKAANNIIENNSNTIASKTAGIYCQYTYNSIIEDNVIRSNQTVFFGGAVYLDNSVNDTIRYNLMYDNVGDPQVRIVNSDSIQYYNNTLDAGDADGYYGAATGSSTVSNNIFINATGTALIATGSQPHNITGSYNLFYNNNTDNSGTVSVSNSLFTDPLLVDTNINNYNLLITSPCIDAGNPSSFYNDSDGSRNDIGALPFDSLQSVSLNLVYPPDIFQETVYNMKPTFIWTTSIDADTTDTVSYSIYLDTLFSLSTAAVINLLEDTTYMFPDSLAFSINYYWKIIASDQIGFENETSINSFWTWTLGDVNNDHQVDIADLVYFVAYAFNFGPPITPELLGDVTGDCQIDIADIVRFVDYMFGGTGTQLEIGCE